MTKSWSGKGLMEHDLKVFKAKERRRLRIKGRKKQSKKLS